MIKQLHCCTFTHFPRSMWHIGKINLLKLKICGVLSIFEVGREEWTDSDTSATHTDTFTLRCCMHSRALLALSCHHFLEGTSKTATTEQRCNVWHDAHKTVTPRIRQGLSFRKHFSWGLCQFLLVNVTVFTTVLQERLTQLSLFTEGKRAVMEYTNMTSSPSLHTCGLSSSK